MFHPKSVNFVTRWQGYWQIGYFRLWYYGPNLVELESEPICYNDLIIILVTLIINFATKLIKWITTFQTKLSISARSDWWLCHRNIVKISDDFYQFKNKIHNEIWYSRQGDRLRRASSLVRIQSDLKFKVFRLNKRRICSFFSKAYKSLNLHILTKNFFVNFITQWYQKVKPN